MRRFIPLMLASSILAIGGGTVVVHYGSSNSPNWWEGWSDDSQARICMKTEELRSEGLEVQLSDVGRRLNLRIESCRLLVAGKIELGEVVDIYHELNLEARDPLHPEDGWRTEHERLDWIAHQISMNIEHVLPETHSEREERDRIAVMNQIQWTMAEAE